MKDTRRGTKWAAVALLAATCMVSTGCQITAGGQTLPSPYYMDDDVQYFPPGSEFKLAREEAAMKAYNSDLQTQRAGNP
jgi:cytochrome P450